MTLREAYAALEAGRYAFVDLGSGRGGSLRHCARRFERAPGVGFEIDASDAAAARRAGLDVVTADATALRLPERSVEFLSAMDFLEHLPDARVASDVLRSCARAARDFVFIRHPSFEEMRYVESLGVRYAFAGHFATSQPCVLKSAITMRSRPNPRQAVLAVSPSAVWIPHLDPKWS